MWIIVSHVTVPPWESLFDLPHKIRCCCSMLASDASSRRSEFHFQQLRVHYSTRRLVVRLLEREVAL